MNLETFQTLVEEDRAAALAAWRAGEVDVGFAEGDLAANRWEREQRANVGDRENQRKLSDAMPLSAEEVAALDWREPWERDRDAASERVKAVRAQAEKVEELIAEREQARLEATPVRRGFDPHRRPSPEEAAALKAGPADDMTTFKAARAEGAAAEAAAAKAREAGDTATMERAEKEAAAAYAFANEIIGRQVKGNPYQALHNKSGSRR